MKRIILATAIAVVGVLGTAATAGAAVGDIRHLSVDDSLNGTANTVEVSGQVRCQATIDYGLVVKATQDPPDTNPIDGPDDGDSGAEATGAFGPNADPGNNANSPCSQNLQSYEVVVERNNGSAFFQDGTVGVIVVAGTSAENGSRGPGPFIADMEYSAENVGFNRIEP